MSSQAIVVAGNTFRRNSPRFPLELIEFILTEAWKSTAWPLERQRLYSALVEVHPVMKEIIDRVAVRNVIFGSLDGEARSDRVLYTNIWETEQACRAHGGSSASQPQGTNAAQIFQRSHVRLDIWLLELIDGFDYLHGLALRPHTEAYRILTAVSSVTLTDCPRKRFADTRPYPALRVLARAPRLTHLHLDYTRCARPPYGAWGAGGVVLPAVVFLRTRTCPSCGAESPGQTHTPECCADDFGAAFPALRELQLDAPLILKHLAPPATLERLAICAPPAVAPFCSIQGYNVATGLRRWMEVKPGKSGAGRTGEAEKMRLREIAVLTGADQPVGWKPAREACERFGVRLVREEVFNC